MSSCFIETWNRPAKFNKKIPIRYEDIKKNADRISTKWMHRVWPFWGVTFFVRSKSQDKNLNILRTKSFSDEMKSIFHHFYPVDTNVVSTSMRFRTTSCVCRLKQIKQVFLKGESPTLSSDNSDRKRNIVSFFGDTLLKLIYHQL